MVGPAGVVTGAGGDIALAVCTELGRRGASVLCVDVTAERAAAGARAVKEAGGTAESLAADVTDEGAVRAYAERCREFWGQATFFFNNAGIEGAEAPLANYPSSQWDRVLGVNLKGVYLGLQAMFPLLRHTDVARVVNTASVAGLIATPSLAAYGASKHAVIGLTKTAAVEWATAAIAVNALCPGPVESAMMRRIEAGVAPANPAAAHSGYEARIPAGRYVATQEVASLAVYLLLDCPVTLTGQAIAIDGGLSAM